MYILYAIQYRFFTFRKNCFISQSKIPLHEFQRRYYDENVGEKERFYSHFSQKNYFSLSNCG